MNDLDVMTTKSSDFVQRVHRLNVKGILELPLVIRSVQHEDLARLEWFGMYARFRDLYQRTWNDHLQGTRLMIVADVNGFPVGQVWVDVTPFEFAYLYAFRVFDPFQGVGIGSQLMDMAEQIAVMHGYREIRLAVERNNPRAQQLYERHNYQIFNQRVDVWSYTDEFGRVQWVEEDVYGMHKRLEPEH
ncbi:MAG: hypothetical protein NVS4B8_27650 [Herpetosiphon sp.]